MASIEQLETALRNADAAGDTQAATTLAAEITKVRGSQAPSKGLLNYVDDAVRSLANGATFNYMDEAAAKLNEWTGLGGTYEQNLAKEQAQDEQIPGVIAIPGQIAGAVAQTLVAAPLAGATRAGQAAANLPKYLKFGGIGAVEGGLSGSGDAKEGERLQGAATGAVIGAPVGAAAPYVVQGVSKLASGVRNAVSPQANVSADLARAIARDADDPASLMARANDLSITRPGVTTLADAGGENVRGLVERVAQTPGAGRTQVVPALTGRQQGQAARISNDLRSLTGTHKTAYQTIGEIAAERKAAADPLYKEATSFDAAAVPEIVQAWQQATSTGWGRSILMSKSFRNTLQTEYGISDPTKAPLMVVIDAWKKEADGVVNNAMSGNRNQARVIGDMRDGVVSVVDEHNPAYKAARDAWSGPSRYMDAIEEGRNILRTNVSAEELAGGLRNMGAADREGFRIGAISAIIGRMGNDSAKLGDMTKYLRSPEVRSKIAAIMPDEATAAEWTRRLDFEVSASELTGKALGNSSTARRLAERQDAENLAGDLILDAMTGTPQSLVKKVLFAGPKWIRDTMRSRADALLADILTNPGAIDELPAVLRRSLKQSSGAVSDRTNAAAAVGASALMAP